MRAVVLREFGAPEVLRVEEVPEPEPIPTEIKVRVRAAGINPVDFKTRAGRGMALAMGEPPLLIGWDVSGTVAEIGPGVTRFRVGDEVFGMPWFPRQAGAYAEYVTAPSRHFAAKPSVLSHEEAAALPLAGLTAWQIIVDTIQLQAGDDLLIHGVAGGVGHLAVQIAKARGANVIGTARCEQEAWLVGLGVDRVIDYRSERFEELLDDLDAVIDLTGKQGEGSLQALRPGGILVSVPSGTSAELIEKAKEMRRRVTGFLVEPDPVGLRGLEELVEAGKLQVHVDKVLDLEQAAEAHRLAEDHHGGGKIVLRVAE
ncbi:MAG TPA: NADP-dependent oxidoreductase [Solirubrobacterales bacterium]|jgi:NADPH:quinone reductase-like Zn-dependent oxidoreductase|nr:NADP-dependent oxidoreductase [Solirubrobacterales bacterium]